MYYYLGIDGGGTGTRAFLAAADGSIIGRGEAGLSSLHHASDEEVRAHLNTAFAAAFSQAGAKPAECVSVFAGMAGVTVASTAARFEKLIRECGLGHATIGVDHDIRIALAGGLGGKPGIALIVGTGSSCYGRTGDGRTCQTGGWGSLIADEGSGYWLALNAIITAVRMADGRMEESPLRAAVFEWLGISDVSEVLKRLYEDGITRTEIAAFAPQVIGHAERGDEAALEILARGADELAELVAANHRRLPTGPGPDLAITGGLGTARTIYREKLEAALRRELPTILISELFMSPTAGAVLLAMEQGGVQTTAEVLSNLRSSS
ncbi:MAG: N-acetylglucosamine kinase [Candidatus Sumerlaeaceae bacterium]